MLLSLTLHTPIAAPTNESTFHAWTVGPVFYSAVVMAEALGGPSGQSQILDVTATDGSADLTPAYAIYDGGALARIVLMNFMTDASGAHDYVATISVDGMPESVQVK